uniref:Eukaryotic translation initiation factor 5 n=1 Tax=Panagrolaimus sp. ES5 TaxID=591445 RepID=A0AC34FHN5_9BILA
MALNVNRSVIDPFYRYKMPRLQAKVEGKGNGIKTVIANMTDIAKALGRPPTYPTKFFGCELGAQTNVDNKNERYIVNGEHDANKLQDLLDIFIKKFVLCPACDNPETVFTVKRQVINSKCKACGHAYVIDPKHKLSTFIIKNPPPSSDNEESEKKQNGGSPVEDKNGFDFKENLDNADDLDDDWAEPEDGEAEKLTAHIGKLVIDKDLDKSVDERLDMLHQFFVKAKKDNTIQDSKKLLNEAERLELKNKAPLLLADVLFDTDVLNQIETHKILLYRFLKDDSKAQRHFLGGIEQLIEKNKSQLLRCAPHIVKKLYDEDLVEEEVLLAWGAKVRKLVKPFQIITRCQPVLKWLEEAEEDSEEESDDDDDDVEVAFDERSREIGTISTEQPKTNGIHKPVEAKAVKVEEEGDEIDIDDI